MGLKNEKEKLDKEMTVLFIIIGTDTSNLWILKHFMPTYGIMLVCLWYCLSFSPGHGPHILDIWFILNRSEVLPDQYRFSMNAEEGKKKDQFSTFLCFKKNI